MSKSVYSLVLSDDVVRAVDQAAYALNTSRSNLINQVLAEYVSFITPEKKMKDIFESLISMLQQRDAFQVQTQGSDSMLSIRSPLRVKYNPTIKYTVELFRNDGNEVGELRIMTRTQSSSLIQLLNQFFRVFSQIEKQYIFQFFPDVTPEYQIQEGKLLRKFSLLQKDCDNQEIGIAIARYIQMIDQALKASINVAPEQQVYAIEQIYRDYLKETPIII